MKQLLDALRHLPAPKRRILAVLAIVVIVTWLSACLVFIWSFAS